MGAYTVDGTAYPSVTTVINELAKPMLVPWAANQAIDFLEEHMDEFLSEENPHRRKDLLDQARKAHDHYRKETAELGTYVHSLIESHVKDGEVHLDTIADERARSLYEAFCDWESSTGVQWIASEIGVHSNQLGVAGTADALGVINGILYFLDFKTTRSIHKAEVSLQLAAYKICYEEMGEEHGPIEKTAVLHLDWREGTVSLVDMTAKMEAAERTYKLLCDFYYSFKKRRVKNPRVQEFYP